MKKNKIILPTVAFAALPQFQSSWTLSNVIDWCLSLMGALVPILIGLAIIAFLYGVLMFIVRSSSGDADGRKEAINFMFFGIIGIAVMVSVWGLVLFVTKTFGVNTIVPQFNSLQ